MSGFGSTIKWGLISLILIMLIHYIFYYLKDTLTTPKIRDLVDEPRETYLEMQETIDKFSLSNKEEKDMKNELSDFLNELSKKKDAKSDSKFPEQYASY
tara:strand:- start:142 stop:438 length:297 start_codon:yes stop_codon:yes gene_type:complete